MPCYQVLPHLAMGGEGGVSGWNDAGDQVLQPSTLAEQSVEDVSIAQGSGAASLNLILGT